MRPIKFRVWDKNEKRMRKVNAIDFKNRKFLELEDEESVSAITCPEGKFPEHFELMQFTGLHDKNGKEIWEGDVMKEKSLNETISVVNFKRGIFCLGKYHIAQYCGKSDVLYMHEVIGNIHENPELYETVI